VTILVKIFGGIGTRLAAVLKAGLTVKRYVYVDNSQVSTRVARHHLHQLMLLYPQKLHSTAIHGCFSCLPRDVTLISEADLRHLDPMDMVIAGWPCQGHSRARAGRGLEDPRSRVFWNLIRLMQWWFAHQSSPLGYILRMYLYWETSPFRRTQDTFNVAWPILVDCMDQQVAAYVGRCEVCDRVRSSFSILSPQLQPLSIMGLGYRWSLDFAGPLVAIPRGAKYVLVMVEHFSKWIEFVALRQNSAELAATAFLDCVLARFGAPAEVLTDQGREFISVFKEL
jgi:hypothetical protein